MSTTLARPASGGGVTQAHILRSEWTKLRSLRSTLWSLLAAVVAMAVLPTGIALVQMSRWSSMSPAERSSFDAIDAGVGGYHLAQLAIGVLAVLVISGEYSTGMIRSSFMAAPRRLPVLWGKVGVFCVVTFMLMLAATLVGFFAVQSIVAVHHKEVEGAKSIGEVENRVVAGQGPGGVEVGDGPW